VDILSLIAIVIILATLVFGLWKRADLTPVLIMGNMLVFLLTILSLEQIGSYHYYRVLPDLGFRPVYLQTGENLYTLLTQMFAHAGIVHILSNMLFLYLVGTPLESRIGKRNFAAVYFSAGIVGVLAESLAQWGSEVLILGASGAISGAMGALLILYPRDEIPFFLGPIFLPRIPVWIAIGSWFGLQVILAFTDPGQVAYMAHLGGFLAGALVAYLRRMDARKEKVYVYDINSLEQLATTPELMEALDRIRGETNQDIQRAWLEYFAARATCPRCRSRMRLSGNKIRCECGFEAGVEWQRIK